MVGAEHVGPVGAMWATHAGVTGAMGVVRDRFVGANSGGHEHVPLLPAGCVWA